MRGASPSAVLAAVLLTGCASAPPVLEPHCADPAPVEGTYHRSTPGYLVTLADDVEDPETIAHELGGKLGFRPESILATMKIFTVRTLTPDSLAALRCEPAIRRITFDEPIHLAHNTL